MTPIERILVYPYMGNGSLASCLRATLLHYNIMISLVLLLFFGSEYSFSPLLAERKEAQPPLDWPKQKRIALGSARGLTYLHEHCDPKIIHHDVKVANILLDHEFEVAIEDFGLARLMNYKDTQVTTTIHGGIGHIAPEYFSIGKCSEKTDIFGYGFMLLELITGQRAFDLAQLANNDDAMLLDWVKGLLKDKEFEKLVDIELQGNYTQDEVEELIQVALLCRQNSPVERPQMSEVVSMLEGEGLAERWVLLQEEEVFLHEFIQAHRPNGHYIIDPMFKPPPDELSGPR